MLNLKFRPLSDSKPARAPIGQVTCPNCRVVMPRISLKTDEGNSLSEAVYRCPRCKTETTRWIKL
jgi:DNA-directed RNA polymerase subunit RPC12/RpoP